MELITKDEEDNEGHGSQDHVTSIWVPFSDKQGKFKINKDIQSIDRSNPSARINKLYHQSFKSRKTTANLDNLIKKYDRKTGLPPPKIIIDSAVDNDPLQTLQPPNYQYNDTLVTLEPVSLVSSRNSNELAGSSPVKNEGSKFELPYLQKQYVHSFDRTIMSQVKK